MRTILILLALCASACSGSPCTDLDEVPPATVVMLPRSVHGDVPANTLLWRYSLEERSAPLMSLGEDVELLHLDEGPQAVTQVLELVGLGVRVEAWRPLEPLQVGAEYEWSGAHPNSSRMVSSFSVGPDADDAPPETPWGERPSRWADLSPFDVCGERVNHEALVPTSTPDLLLLAVRHDSGPVDGQLPEAAVDGATDQPGVWLRGYWPLTVQGVRLANVDLAGNVSDWSEPIVVAMPAAGCSSGRSQALLLVPLLGLGWIRRRGSAARVLLPPGRRGPGP